MSEIVERAARRLAERRVYSGYDAETKSRMVEREMYAARNDARAVLEAIREPSAAMLNAEHPHRIDGANHLSQGTARAVWQSMIDAALKEEPK